MKALTYENFSSYKVRLFPTKEQKKIFYEYFGVCRFVYNLGINLEEQQYQDFKDGKTDRRRLYKLGLNNLFTHLKNNVDEYKWLKKYDATTLKIVLFDVEHAYDMCFNPNSTNRKPKYKSRIYSNKQFPVRPERLSIDEQYVRIPSIGYVKYCNSYGNKIVGSGHEVSPNRINFYNARVSFDGLNFYLSFSIPKDKNHNINSYQYYDGNTEWQSKESSDAIGIDVGLKREKWMVDSTGTKLERPDSSKLMKKINRLTRKLERQRKINKSKNRSFNDQYPDGSKNMQKTKAEINKCFKKITNRRRNAIYGYTKTLLDKKPKAIVMETISVANLLVHDNDKNCSYHKRKMNELVYDASLYESMKIIENKMRSNNIPVIYAESDYPSSQLCSNCGNRQDIGRRKIYKCPICGTIIDRDVNAAINLAKLAY